jgi:glycosyltransferase involved in cell wall biosynthesis
MKLSRKEKLVSVIINCYNSEKYLKKTIESVVSQTYKNWEIIFYDNKSNDNSYQIFKSFNDKRLKYFKSKKFESLGVARKNALKKAKGYYIAYLDSDDLWEKNKLKIQLKYFNKKEIGFTISNSIFFNKKNKKYLYPNNKKFNKNVFYDLIKNYFISFDTVIVKRSSLQKLSHGIDERFDIIHDMDLLIRLSKRYKMNYVPLPLSMWRMREDSLSYNSFKKIIKEKKIFIKKINKKFKNDQKFIENKLYFMDSLYRQEILYLISKNRYNQAFKIIKKLKINVKNILLTIIIFFPFKKLIFKKFLNLKY